MKTLKFTTCKPCFMGTTDNESIRCILPRNSKLNQFKTKGVKAYIHGEAETIAGYDIPIMFDGDMEQLDVSENLQAIVMYIDDVQYRIKATLQKNNTTYYLELK